MSELEGALSKLVQLKCITDGGLGAETPTAGGYGSLAAKPLAAGRFFVIKKKNIAISLPLNHLLHVFRAI